MAKPIDTATYEVYVIKPEASSLLSKEFPIGTAFARIDQARPRSCFYYEGNIYNAVNLNTFAEKAQCASGRGRMNYPTIARAWFSLEEIEENFVKVGSIDQHYIMSLTDSGKDLLTTIVGEENIGLYVSDSLEPHSFKVGKDEISFKAPHKKDAQSLLLMKYPSFDLFAGKLGQVAYKAPGQTEFTVLIPSAQG